jgi:5-formyltetrahydrofolate cyclo-ligase
LGNAELSAKKQEMRERVWSLLEKEKVTRFPKPVFGRIPNFEGAEKAAARLRELKVFSDANAMKVNPDAPQRPVRENVLRARKELLVPTPRLGKGFLLIGPDSHPSVDVGLAATTRGAWKCGRPVGLRDLPTVDLIVTGTVAVSQSGVRIGKGGGYSEIEYGILQELRLVDENTPIVTTVHDLQIVEEVPAEEHDLTVDAIVTPTRVIDTCRKRPQPKGIYWDEVTDLMLEEIPLLKELAETRRT